MCVKKETDFVKASKKKKVILLETKNYDVFIEYKTLYKKRKTEWEISVRNYIYSYLNWSYIFWVELWIVWVLNMIM